MNTVYTRAYRFSSTNRRHLRLVECAICGRELTDPESVERQIGPVCYDAIQKINHHKPEYEQNTQTVNPSDVIVEDRLRKDKGDLLELIESIATIGLLHPIVITKNNRLVVGERRLEAWKILYGNYSIPCSVIPHDLDDDLLLQAEIQENEVRKDFTPEEKVQIYYYYKPKISIEAEKRIKAGIKQPSGKFPEGDTRDVIGDVVGVSGKTLEKIVKVYEAAKEEPEKYGFYWKELEQDKETPHGAYTKLIQKQGRIKPERVREIDYPDGVYRTIVIDPPWPVKKIERQARPNQGLYLDYPIMELEEIAKIPVQELAYEEGTHIYLWVTQKYLPEGLKLFEKWGVKYQCLLTWVKPTGITPYSWMYNTEHVLFGRVGTLQLNKLGIKLAFEAKNREHSRKPDEFYSIVKEVSPEPRIDLFAREARQGFITWGDETEKFGGIT